MLSTAGADHIITMDLHASQIQVLHLTEYMLGSNNCSCLHLGLFSAVVYMPSSVYCSDLYTMFCLMQ